MPIRDFMKSATNSKFSWSLHLVSWPFRSFIYYGKIANVCISSENALNGHLLFIARHNRIKNASLNGFQMVRSSSIIIITAVYYKSSNRLAKRQTMLLPCPCKWASAWKFLLGWRWRVEKWTVASDNDNADKQWRWWWWWWRRHPFKDAKLSYVCSCVRIGTTVLFLSVFSELFNGHNGQWEYLVRLLCDTRWKRKILIKFVYVKC